MDQAASRCSPMARTPMLLAAATTTSLSSTSRLSRKWAASPSQAPMDWPGPFNTSSTQSQIRTLHARGWLLFRSAHKVSGVVGVSRPFVLRQALDGGQSGRVIITFRSPFGPASYFVATTSPAGTPFSTHASSASNNPYFGPFAVGNPNCPNASGPGPPPQWSTPGAI